MKIKLAIASALVACLCVSTLCLKTSSSAKDLTADLKNDDDSFSDTDITNQVRAVLPSRVLADGHDGEHIIKPSRDQQVRDQLALFIQRTAHVTKETINEERETIARGLMASLNHKTTAPEIKIITANDGNLWQELRYDDGIVRYLPAEKTEQHL